MKREDDVLECLYLKSKTNKIVTTNEKKSMAKIITNRSKRHILKTNRRKTKQKVSYYKMKLFYS
jgi:hypothetical protein